jgi:hypothetical protein
VPELLNALAGDAKSYAQGEASLRRGLAILRRLGPGNEVILCGVLVGLATNLQCQERPDEAETAARAALTLARCSLTDNIQVTADALYRLGSVLRETRHFEEARSVLREYCGLSAKLHGEGHPLTIRAILELMEIELDQRDQAAAEPLLRQLLDATSRWSNHAASYLEAVVIAELGFRLTDECRRSWDQGDATRAAECAQAAERILRPLATARAATGAPSDWLVLWTRSLLGGALIAVATTDDELSAIERSARFAEVETLLLDVEGKFSAQAYPSPREAYHKLSPTYERLVALYLRWEEVLPCPECPAKQADWRHRLEELERNAGKTPGPRMSDRLIAE